MTRDQILKRLTEINIIYREPVKFFSRATGNFYCNIKKAFGYSDILNSIADLIGERLQENENCIVVSGYGGLLLGAVVASRFNRKIVTVRKEEKKLGPRGLIDGYLPTENDTVVILDDILATGDSIRTLLISLRKMGVKISRALVVVEVEKVKLPIPYEFIFSIDEIIKNNSLKPQGLSL